MNHLALLPLALFANACASADEVADAATETAEEVRESVENYDMELDRDSVDFNKDILRYAARSFKNEMIEGRCELMGALVGDWRDRNFRINFNLIDIHGESFASMRGGLGWDANNTGEVWGKGINRHNDSIITLEGNWYDSAVEGDMTVNGADKMNFVVFADKFNRGLGGLMIGAIASCR
jgi:hypothetical protein